MTECTREALWSPWDPMRAVFDMQRLQRRTGDCPVKHMVSCRCRIGMMSGMSYSLRIRRSAVKGVRSGSGS